MFFTTKLLIKRKRQKINSAYLSEENSLTNILAKFLQDRIKP